MPEESPAKRKTAAPKTAGSAVAATPAKAPATRKTTTAAEKKTPASKTAAEDKAPTTRRKAPAKKTPVPPSAEERYGMVQNAAYYLAEKDGFQGAAVDYWIQAEQEIAAQLGEIKD